jgi:hydroxylamine reductase (hybrid-cluster protein)
MALLDEANTKAYGQSEITEVEHRAWAKIPVS